MLTPLKSIRAKCIDCCCGNMAEVNRCSLEHCPLHPYRFGKNPNNSRKPTTTQLEALRKGRVPFLSVENNGGFTKTATPEGKDTTPDNSPEKAQLVP